MESKYVFMVERNKDGVNNCKVILVILGNMQMEGKRFFYACVKRYQSLGATLALTTEEGMLVQQMDVKITFFNGDLEEKICMKQLYFLVKEKSKNKIWKLKKAFCEHKQA